MQTAEAVELSMAGLMPLAICLSKASKEFNAEAKRLGDQGYTSTVLTWQEM